MRRLVLLFNLLVVFALTATAQTGVDRTVSGTILDATGEALIGASILVKGTSVGTISDIDGNFKLLVPSGRETLVFSYTGFSPQEITLTDASTYEITLSEGIEMEEVVVTAIGISKDERSVGYAVQTVDGSEILQSKETNLVQSLAGKVAGVQINNSSGAAGGSSYIQIRGANSINGNNQPLFVVDGVPVDNSQLRSGDATGSVALSNRAIDLNPNEIESITVLKGAAATALYGSQAGNGAIIVTTKKGATGDARTSVDFSQDLTFSQISQTQRLQSTYAQGLGGVYQGPESGSGYSYGPNIDTLRYNGDPNYPWNGNKGAIVGQSEAPDGERVTPYDQYEFFRAGVSSNTNVAIAASTDKSNIRFSIGYQHDEGIVPNNTFDKLNIGLNAGTDLGDKVNLSLGLQYINSGGTRIEQGSNTSGVMLGLTRTTPTFHNDAFLDDPVDNPLSYSFPEDNSQRNYRGGGGYDNPYWTINNNPLTDNVNRVIGNITASYRPTDWLTFTYRPGLDYYSDFRYQYFAIGSRSTPRGQVFEDQFFVSRFNADAFATLQKSFGDFDGSLILGHNLRTYGLEELRSTGDNLVIPGFYDISNGAIITSFKDEEKTRNQALYASFDLNWRRTLYLTLTGRVESESTLPIDNNQFPYGSAGLSFVFSELLDQSQNSLLSFGKVRGSYGLVGLGAPPFRTRTYFGNTQVGDGWVGGDLITFPFNDVAAFSRSDVLGSSTLEPEQSRSIEVGVDLRFLNNRIGLDVTYYDNLSSKVILTAPVAPSAGFTNQVINAAELSNKGLEVVLTGSPVRGSDFNWDIVANFTRNKNEVEQLTDGVENVFLGGFTGASTRAVAGFPYATIFGFGFYKDASGTTVIGEDGFPIIDPRERAFASAQPDFILGLRNTFTYKNFTLSGLMEWKQGGVVWNGTKSALYFWGTAQESADRLNTTEVFPGNVGVFDSEGELVLADDDGDPTTPEVAQTSGANDQEVLVDQNWLAFGDANGFFGNNSEDFIEDASWLRLRDVSLGYSVPSTSLPEKYLKAINFTLTARNLFLDTPYSGVDPDTNLYGASNAQGLDYFNMPGTKSYTFSVQATF